VTESDVTYVINYLPKGGAFRECPQEPHIYCKDCSRDEKVTIADAIYLINFVVKIRSCTDLLNGQRTRRPPLIGVAQH
jgi:hypothetical protein